MQEILPPLLRGTVVTIQLTVGGIALATAIALASGLMRSSRRFFLRWPAIVYTEVFRGTSALVQLFWFFYVLPFFGINLDALMVGILVLGLNAGAYGSEVVRGAVAAVPKGQWEAAAALNMTRTQALTRIILPQALLSMLPPLGNIYIELLKNTALVSFITLSELTFAAQTLRFDTMRTVEIFVAVLVIYFLLAQVIVLSARYFERLLGRGLHVGVSR